MYLGGVVWWWWFGGQWDFSDSEAKKWCPTIVKVVNVWRYDMIYTINITSMMVLASIYLSVSNSLPRYVHSCWNHSDYLSNFFKHWYHKASGKLVTVQPCIPFYGYNHKYYWAGKNLVLLISIDTLILCCFRNMSILSNTNKQAQRISKMKNL